MTYGVRLQAKACLNHQLRLLSLTSACRQAQLPQELIHINAFAPSRQ
jgi:hypothetical protein